MKKDIFLTACIAVLATILLVGFLSAFHSLLLSTVDIITEKAKNDYSAGGIAIR